jgi:N-methylhydantoinase A
MARVLGMDRFMIPKFSAGLSAYGGLFSDIRWEETATLHTNHRAFDFETINTGLASLQARGAAFLASAGVAESQRHYEYAFYGRYRYQSWEIEVPFAGAPIAPGDLETLERSFHDMHERIYTIRDDDELVEFTTWRVRAIGKNAHAGGLEPHRADEDKHLSPKSERAVFVQDSGGMTVIPVYDGGEIGPAHIVRGPAIIEEETFTSLLLEKQEARIGETGDYLVTTAT